MLSSRRFPAVIIAISSCILALVANEYLRHPFASNPYHLQYYNVKRQTWPFSSQFRFDTSPSVRRKVSSSFLSQYPVGGAVIVTLVSSLRKDVDDACLALKSLAFLQGDDDRHPAPVLIFNEGDLTDDQLYFLVSCTERPIAFPLVDFTTFPGGFDKQVNTQMFHVEKRKEWGYYQMLRFWITAIWKHPALEPYETIMRIDSDSCFTEKNDFLPNFRYDGLIYFSQYVGMEDGKDYTIGLLDTAEKFMKSIGQKSPNNLVLWDFIKTSWEKHQTLPVFRTNLEVCKKSFMTRWDVMQWHETLTEKEPFGVFRYRWADSAERYLTMAMFGSMDKVMMSYPVGYGHKEMCAKEQVLESIEKLDTK